MHNTHTFWSQWNTKNRVFRYGLDLALPNYVPEFFVALGMRGRNTYCTCQKIRTK